MRTCVACRRREDRDDLIRLVVGPEGIAVDLRARLPGRGAWVHAERACIERLVRRPAALERALRADGLEVGQLLSTVRDAVRRSLLDGLSMAAAAGALVGGHDALEAALREGRVTELVVACDASPRTLSDLRRAAGEAVPFTTVPVEKGELGERVGRGARAALGVAPSRATHHLRTQLHRLRGLG